MKKSTPLLKGYKRSISVVIALVMMGAFLWAGRSYIAPSPAFSASSTASLSPQQCHEYTQGASIPTGFGAPWDVFSSSRPLTMSVMCMPGTATIRVNDNPNPQYQYRYAYNKGYYFIPTVTQSWTLFTFTGEGLINNAWLPQSATADISIPSSVSDQSISALSYICTYTGSVWKCGCRDTACTQNYWQLQRFRQQEAAESDVSYVFVTRSEARLGGMPGAINHTYAAKDGVVQSSQERSDDIVLALREGTRDISGTFPTLDTSALNPIPVAYASPSPGSTTVPEVSGPTLFVEVAFSDTPTRQWVGNPDDAPASVQDLVQKVEQLAAQAPSVPLTEGARFVRTQILPPYQAEFIGGIVAITADDLARNATLGQAVTHTRRLISAPAEELLYSALPLTFRHGISAHLSYEQRVYQIRHLVADMSDIP